MSNTRKFTGRLVSWILIITFLTTSMLMLPQNAYAAGLGEDSYTSDVPSYIQPDELMNKIPHLGADPLTYQTLQTGSYPVRRREAVLTVQMRCLSLREPSCFRSLLQEKTHQSTRLHLPTVRSVLNISICLYLAMDSI